MKAGTICREWVALIWWALVSEKKSVSELSQKQRETIKRIQGETESIIQKEENRT